MIIACFDDLLTIMLFSFAQSAHIQNLYFCITSLLIRKGLIRFLTTALTTHRNIGVKIAIKDLL